MRTAPAELQQTVSYRSRAHVGLVRLGLIALALGALCLVLSQLWDDRDLLAPGIAGVLAGVICLATALYQVSRPDQSMLVLTPAGLVYRNVSSNRVPWHEIQAVDLRDHTVRFRGSNATFTNVTVVWVSHAFYESHIHIRSFFWRGPYWGNNFIIEDLRVGIVIVPALMRAQALEVHEAVRRRWRAFAGPPPAGAAPALPQTAWAGDTPRRGRVIAAIRNAPLPILLAAGAMVALALFLIWRGPGGDVASRSTPRGTPFDEHLRQSDQAYKQAREEFDRAFRKMDEDFERIFGRESNAPARDATAARQPQPAVPAAPASPEAARVSGHREAVLALSVGRDGHTFVSAGGDGAIKLWDTRQSTARRDIGTGAAIARTAIVLPDGVDVITASDDGAITIRAIIDGMQRHRFDVGEHGTLAALAVTPDGRRAVSTHDSGAIVLIDLAARRPLAVFNSGGMRQQAAAFSPDGRQLLTGGSDGVPRLWDVDSGALLRAFDAHQGPVYAVAFAPDGTRAFSGGGDSTLRLWRVDDGRELRRFEGHARSVYALAVSADGARAVTGSIDGTARLWDVETGTTLRRIEGHAGPVYAVAFAADEAILTGGADRTIRVWRKDGVEAMRYFGALPR